MPERTSYAPGTPCWVDLGTPDIEATRAFYQGLFGWEGEDQGPEAGGYVMLRLNGKDVAAAAPAPPERLAEMGGRPAWTTYISVENVDATAKAIEANGGKLLMPPMDVMTAGRMLVAMDPTGGAFAIWQPGEHIGATLVNEPGTLCWNELTVRDADAAIAFYSAVFGYEAKTSDSGGMPYTEFQVEGRAVAGLMAMTDEWPPEVPSHWMPYFAVADCDAAAKLCVELGGATMVPPSDIPPGRFAVLNDPQGAVFSILQASPGMLDE